MKNLKEAIYESMNVNEGLSTKDTDKLHSIMSSDSKLKSYIKKHESDITEDGLGSSDVTDIKDIMTDFHGAVVYMLAEEPENLEQYLEDAPSNLADDHDDDWIEIAIDLYKTLFKELTGKDLK